MTAFNGYPFSVFVAVTFHGLVLGFLMLLSMDKTQEQVIVRAPMVKALLVNENPQTKNERRLERRRLVRLDEQRAALEREEARELLAGKERQRADELGREADRKRELERVALREQQLRDKESTQSRRREAEQRERENELRRQQELADQRAAELERQIADADRRALENASAEQARTDAELVQSYAALIAQLVEQNWSRPPSARNGMITELRITMVPTGEVVNVEIVQSSGDYAFDRAAETAVYKVGGFRELQGMPIRLFEREFRQFRLIFRPEDLLN